jgi:APA family basic amino acid/polyamine antiporter
MNTTDRRLVRTLGLPDATLIGVGSMIGAGVYVVWSQAADAAGSQLLLGLVIAGVIAVCNALASGRLAALYPESGGTYVYALERLGPTRGFIAGWGFVIGKTASCAAMALVAGAYLWPAYDRLLAVIAIVVITLVNIGGIERTVRVTKFLLAITATVLAVVIISGWSGNNVDIGRLAFGSRRDSDGSWAELAYGIFQSAGLLFFAFAGYARIATLGEEVSNPTRTIPRAILLALTMVISLYSLVAVTVLVTVHPADLAGSSDPLRLVVESSRWNPLGALVRVGAGIAAFGALLNLIPGVSRTILAMARRRDLPTALAYLSVEKPKPVRAEITVAAAAIGLVVTFDIRNAIGVSGVGVLAYYAITNWSALTLPLTRFQRAQSIVGLVGCVSLVICLPGWSVLTGTLILVSGLALRTVQVFHLRRQNNA